MQQTIAWNPVRASQSIDLENRLRATTSASKMCGVLSCGPAYQNRFSASYHIALPNESAYAFAFENGFADCFFIFMINRVVGIGIADSFVKIPINFCKNFLFQTNVYSSIDRPR